MSRHADDFLRLLDQDATFGQEWLEEVVPFHTVEGTAMALGELLSFKGGVPPKYAFLALRLTRTLVFLLKDAAEK